MRTAALIVVIMLAIIRPAFAVQTGNQYEQQVNSSDIIEKSIALGYLMGIVDSQRMSNTGWVRCIPSSVTYGQLVLVMQKYMRDNPAVLHYEAALIIPTALGEAYRCSDDPVIKLKP